MCIFSSNVRSVSSTRIFARTDGLMQALVYQMKFEADNPLAMILPIPVIPRSHDDAVTFVDLSLKADFFDKLDAKFLALDDETFAMSRGIDSFRSKSTLKVHDVGDFQASFVPTLADMERLDTRFTLPPYVWEKIPQYTDYGFAVFKLNSQKNEDQGIQMPRRVTNVVRSAARRDQAVQQPHPMAFWFPTRWATATFFPTVHIHDGDVHPVESFDHTLYAQVADERVYRSMRGVWAESTGNLGEGIDSNYRVYGKRIIDSDRLGYKATLKGELTNIDVILR